MRSNRRWLVLTALALLVASSACGSGDGAASSGSTSSSRPDDRVDFVVDKTVSSITKQGVEVDRDCIEALVRKLSAADLELVADAAAQADPEDPDLSEAGDGITKKLAGCVQGADPDLIERAVQRVVTAPDGDAVDEACLRKQFAYADEDALQALADDGPSADDPAQSDLFGAVALCADIGSASVPETAAPTIDPCALLDEAARATAFAELGAGEKTAFAGTYGGGVQCQWQSASGERLRVGVTDDADLGRWRTEATDGDGLDDGAPVDGVGDAAYTGSGSISFAAGTQLVQITCFPGFDIDPSTLTALAHSVEAAL